MTKGTNQVFTVAEYEALLERTFEQIRELGRLKGGEYSGDVDRLANFRRNGAALGLPMETIWAVYSAKHWDAVMQFVQDLTTGKTRKRLEPIEGRVDDLIVYLLLFKAMLIERHREDEPEPEPEPEPELPLGKMMPGRWEAVEGSNELRRIDEPQITELRFHDVDLVRRPR